MPKSWSYGITTVPSRFSSTLPRTVASLAAAGFEHPRFFVDGYFTHDQAETCPAIVSALADSRVTAHFPNITAYGNWVLAAWELYLRLPRAVYYAIFQDDLVACRGLREYLENCAYPPAGYWNLYTFPFNESGQTGWYIPPGNRDDRGGFGAVGLVFSNDGLRKLLATQHMVDRPLDAMRGGKLIDGGVYDAMRAIGIHEEVHSPCLIQHIGDISSLQNRRHAQAITFRGEQFDAMTLLKENNA